MHIAWIWFYKCLLICTVRYAWDEPTLEPFITLSVHGGTSGTYNMNKLEEGEQLCYENFIFLGATSTFNR